MVDPLCPIALPPIYSIDFIEYILKLHSAPTTLVICASREAFLQSLQADIYRVYSEKQSDLQEDLDPVPLHPLLSPTIHLLATSRTVHLVFTPTLPHLRAFLTGFKPRGGDDVNSSPCQKLGFRIPLLAIFGLITIHRSTSEYAAQGLSRTIAAAVEAAHYAGMKLVLAEPCNENETENEDENTPNQDQWKAQVPLLNGSIRVGEGNSISASRTINVGSVVCRWCRFVGLDEDSIG